MSEKPTGLDIPWVKKQVKEGLNFNSDNIKGELENLQKDVLVAKLRALDFSGFNKGGTVENSAAHIVLVQKALNLINGDNAVQVDGILRAKTKEAIRKFQASLRGGTAITKDGIPGDNTKKKLIAALSDGAGASPNKDANTQETAAKKVEKAKTGVLSMLTSIGITGVAFDNN